MQQNVWGIWLELRKPISHQSISLFSTRQYSRIINLVPIAMAITFEVEYNDVDKMAGWLRDTLAVDADIQMRYIPRPVNRWIITFGREEDATMFRLRFSNVSELSPEQIAVSFVGARM